MGFYHRPCCCSGFCHVRSVLIYSRSSPTRTARRNKWVAPTPSESNLIMPNFLNIYREMPTPIGTAWHNLITYIFGLGTVDPIWSMAFPPPQRLPDLAYLNWNSLGWDPIAGVEPPAIPWRLTKNDSKHPWIWLRWGWMMMESDDWMHRWWADPIELRDAYRPQRSYWTGKPRRRQNLR